MEKRMNENFLSHIIAISAFVAFVALGLACGTTPDGSSGGSSGYNQSSVNTASVTSQYSIGLTSNYSKKTISDQFNDIVYLEVTKLRQVSTVTFITRNEWDKNSWFNYIVNLAMHNRNWYKRDFGYVYRTNLISNTDRKYVVFTCIVKGNYYTDTLELTSYEFFHYAYEIN